ncbi:MAG: endonuclease Q family protein [Desulfomonilaceae bacterium]
MIYYADLHVHSRYSRATSKDCDLNGLSQWAALKGINVVATGDFTHPEWRKELHDKLEPREDGLFGLKPESTPSPLIDSSGFAPCDVRFILNVEISSIYKKNGKVRKAHNLIFMPDMETMDDFCMRLGKRGNLNSDGRPILGLDCRDLLEIALETSERSFAVPAHIWTPWFSALGSKSGFDSMEECFEDLTEHVLALETGLSSDPEMNFRVSELDRFTLISNSDTHSPSRLGREVNIFSGQPSYPSIREALCIGGAGSRNTENFLGPRQSIMEDRRVKSGASGFVGTIEFFPEEGKYHMDGHRKCGIRLDPEKTEALGGKCPVCGHAITVGVMNRVNQLADRPYGHIPPKAGYYWRMLPLIEIVADCLGCGVQAKKARDLHYRLIRDLGPELDILWSLPLDVVETCAPPIFVEALRRVRAEQVRIDAGYDGEYGKVSIFEDSERKAFG